MHGDSKKKNKTHLSMLIKFLSSGMGDLNV